MSLSSRASRLRGPRWARSLATAAVAVVVLSGCAVAQQSTTGSSTTPSGTTDSPSGTADSSGEAPAESTADGPTEGGTLRIAAAADAQPQFAMANRAGNWSWRRLVFDSLIELDANATPQPLLATSWSYNDDRTQLTLKLRDGVTFHSGRAFTAADVVYSFEQVKLPANASQLAGVAQGITDVSAPDDHTAVITLAAPSDSLFDLLDLTPIVDSETWGAVADGKEVIGTGPFTWKNWTPGASITLEKNPDYWGDQGPYFDEVSVSIISDSTALQSAITSGAADVAIGMAQADVVRLGKDSNYTLQNAGGVFYPFGVDVEQAPFDKAEARQALAYAIDRERITEQVFGGDGVLTDLWWTPNSPGYPSDLEQHYSYDPDKAKSLLEESGAAGADLKITYANLPVMKSLFEIVQNNLQEVGLNVTGEALDLPEYDKRQVDGSIGQSFLLLHGMVGFSTATLIDAMPSIRTGNASHFDTPEYTSLKDAVRGADDSTRDAAVKALSEYMLDQSFSNIIAVAPQYHVQTSALQGLRVVSLGSIVATDAFLPAK